MMNQLAIDKSRNSVCDDLAAIAEREFAAFFNTVKELFGSEQAEISAEEWLQELDAGNCLPSSARDWQRITLNVFVRLASQVSGHSVSTASLVLA